MTIGSITVDLLARTGSFETDLNRAAKQAERRAKEIDRAISEAGAKVGAALGAAGVAAVYFGQQLIDGLDALNDVADATGASVENLSALEDVAVRTGASMDTVSGILVKFNGVLKDVDGKNAASQALKALGLDAEELKRIDPAEALRRTAVALAGFADDGNKARIVQELFGKSIKEAAPFLKDLAEQTSLVGKVTAEQTQAAEDFNKSLFELQKNAADAGRSLLKNLLPAMNEIIKAFNSGGLMAGLDAFGNKVLDWEGNAQRKGISNLKKEIASLAEEANAVTFDIFGQKGKIQQDIDAKTAALKAAEAAYFKLNPAPGGGRGSINPALVDPRTSLPSVAAVKDPKKAAAPKESEYQKYLENLGKELSRTEELSRAGMVLADIQSGRLKLLKGESAEPLLAIAREIDANKALTEEKKRRTEFDNQLRESVLRDMETQEQQVKTLEEGNKAMREEIELIGKNAEAQAAIEQARLSSAIAIKEEQLARSANTEFLSRESAALQEQIRLLTERKELVGLKGATQQIADDAKKTEELANSIGAAFSSSFEKAALEGGKLSDVLKGLGKDIAALVLRQTITVPLSNSIATALKTSSSGTSGGGGFDFGSLINGIVGIFGGKFADGGSPPVGKISLVGERGPELFVPNTAGRIIPNHALQGGSAPVNVVINNTVGDVATLSMLKEAQRGTEQRIAATLGRSRSYRGAAA